MSDASPLYEIRLVVDGHRDAYTARWIEPQGQESAPFPLILPQATTMGLFMLVWQLAAFDLVYAMTGGGPGFATQVLAYNIYQAAFGGLNFGYASAISLVLFALVIVMGGLGLLLYRRVEISY